MRHCGPATRGFRSTASHDSTADSQRRFLPLLGVVTPAFVLLLLLAPFAPLSAQTVRGHLTGRVVDDQSIPLSDVRITVAGPSLQGAREVTSNEVGFFRVLELPIGSYTVEFTHPGYRQVVYEDVRISLGSVRTIGDVQLETTAFQLSPLRVTALAPVIDPVSTTMGSGLDAADFERLPINRRDYQSVISILPHANESFVGDGVTIGGSTGLENTYYVDGANVTDLDFGAGGSRLPWNFVESMRIRNGGYQAEYGKALGGIVDAVTYSGSNEFELDVFGFFSGSALADAPKPGLKDLRADDFHTTDIGFRLGGPVIRDRVWYAAAYNPRIESIDRELVDQSVHEDRETIHAFAGKITWQPYPHTDVNLSVFGDPSTHTAVEQGFGSLSAPSHLENPEPMLTSRKDGGTTVSLRLRHELGPQVILHGDFSRHSGSSRLAPLEESDTPLQLFADLTTNTWSGGPGRINDSSTRRTAARMNSTFLLGQHTAKIGVEYEDNRSDFSLSNDFVLRMDSATYRRQRESTAAPHHNRAPAVFVQDSWQLTPRLAVSAGLRWSRQQLEGDGGAGVQTFPDQWQPRFGAVYQFGRIGTQRVLASYGRYFQQLPLYFSQIFYAPYDFRWDWFSEDPRLPGVQPDSSLIFPSDIPHEVDGVRVEHFDELTAGYERAVGRDYVLGARVVHRVLRDGFGYGVDPPLFAIGNFGEGELDFLPRATRKYSALELTLHRAGRHRLQGFVSYVLSRTHGNYTGVFPSDQGVLAPHNNPSNKFAEQGPNSTGLLPNDRTHVVKVAGSYAFSFGLTAGTFFTVQSGTPLNDFGAGSRCPFCPLFLVPRGTAGRSSTLWDLNLSFAYGLPLGSSSRSNGRLFLDVMHVGSPRSSAWVDQVRFLSQDADGNQINPNPNFGETLAFQPPMAARLGIQWSFGGRPDRTSPSRVSNPRR